MNDWMGFLKIYGSVIGIIGILTFINNETLWIIFAVVVIVGTIWMSFGGGGGRGDGGMDGGNY